MFRDCTVQQSSPESPGGRDYARFLLLLELHRACQVVHPSAVRVDEWMNEWRISTGQGPDISEAECPFPRMALVFSFIPLQKELGVHMGLRLSYDDPAAILSPTWKPLTQVVRSQTDFVVPSPIILYCVSWHCTADVEGEGLADAEISSPSSLQMKSWSVAEVFYRLPSVCGYLVSWKNSFLPQAASRPALVLAPLTLWRSLGLKKVLLHRNQKLKRFIYFNPFFIHTNLSLCFPSCFVIPFNLVFLSFSFYFYSYPSWSNFFHMINLCKKCFGFTSAVNRILRKTYWDMHNLFCWNVTFIYNNIFAICSFEIRSDVSRMPKLIISYYTGLILFPWCLHRFYHSLGIYLYSLCLLLIFFILLLEEIFLNFMKLNFWILPRLSVCPIYAMLCPF